MRFSLVATAFIPVLSAAADNILVTVGAGGQFAFQPTNVTAKIGDTIAFQFQGKNHSVTQSTFADPCTKQTVPKPGVDSGFQPVAPNATMLPQWSFNVDNDTTPLWFFCAQTGHCQMGMVFSVNADPDSAKSFAVYQASAKSAPSTGASNAAANNGDTAGASSNVASDASSTAGVTTTGSAPASDLSSGSPTLSSSASNPSNSTQAGGGFRLERSTSLPVLTALGLASVLLL